jgi:hypothetical protein
MDATQVVAQVRRANTEIAALAADAGFDTAVPFICECGDPTCRGLALLSLDAFSIVATQQSWTVLGNAHGVHWRIVDTDSWKTVKESRLDT